VFIANISSPKDLMRHQQKKETQMRYLLFTLLLLPLAACDTSSELETPTRQKAFIKKIESLEQNYELAKDTGNDLQIQKVEKEIKKELKQTNRRANGWAGIVEEVTTYDKGVTVTLKNSTQSYHLELLDSKLQKMAETLQKGQPVVFSGDLGEEVSFTLSGAVSEPEFRFPPISVKRVGDETRMEQDPALIEAERQAERKEKVDNAARLAVMEACQEKVTQALQYPESASFSWTQSGFGKTDDGRWVYEDVVEAKNGLGAEIPRRFRCIATIEAAGEKMGAEVVNWAFTK
jgi:hypothetical protein